MFLFKEALMYVCTYVCGFVVNDERNDSGQMSVGGQG